MASFLFVPYSVVGHVNPMLPVMAELVARGASVRALVGRRFAAPVRDSGADVVALDAVPDAFVPEHLLGAGGLRFLTGRARRVVVNRQAAQVLADELLRHPPDLVALDPMLGWADRVVRRRSVRSAVFSTTFAMSPYPARVLALRHGRGWTAGLQRARPLVRRHRRRLVLANALPELQPAAEHLDSGTYLVGPLLRRPAGARRPGPRCLFVSPGTVFARGPALFRTVANAFAGTDWSVIMATGHTDPATIGPLPANVTAQRWVEQQDVLAQADVFLTHAGMNSALEALAAGVPMVLAPRSAEQRFIAAQLVAMGVGVRLEPGRLPELATRLATDPAVRAAVAGWRDRRTGAGGQRRAAELLLSEVSAVRRGAEARTAR